VQKHLLKTLAKGKGLLRPWTGLGLGVWGELLNKQDKALPTDVTLALRSAMIDENNPSRFGAYAIACGMVKDQDSAEALLKKLDEMRTNEARGYACVALGMMNAAGAKETIEGIVEDSAYRPELLQQAAIALGLLGDKTLVAEMVEMLRNAKGLATQAALSHALGFIGDKNSVDPLVEMLGNQELTATARGFAAVALGIVADKEKLPWNSKIAFGVNYRAASRTLNDTEGTGILNIL
jgi:HEAT repeat protein